MSTITPLLISREEAAQLLGGISLRHLDRLCAKGVLAKRRLGGRAMIVRTSLEEYVSPPAPYQADSFELAFPTPTADGSRLDETAAPLGKRAA